jgi:hypothetical protein
MDEECWETLGAVRQAMEEFVPIGPVDETTAIAAEAEAGLADQEARVFRATRRARKPIRRYAPALTVPFAAASAWSAR